MVIRCVVWTFVEDSTTRGRQKERWWRSGARERGRQPYRTGLLQLTTMVNMTTKAFANYITIMPKYLTCLKYGQKILKSFFCFYFSLLNRYRKMKRNYFSQNIFLRLGLSLSKHTHTYTHARMHEHTHIFRNFFLSSLLSLSLLSLSLDWDRETRSREINKIERNSACVYL